MKEKVLNLSIEDMRRDKHVKGKSARTPHSIPRALSPDREENIQQIDYIKMNRPVFYALLYNNTSRPVLNDQYKIANNVAI